MYINNTHILKMEEPSNEKETQTVTTDIENQVVLPPPPIITPRSFVFQLCIVCLIFVIVPPLTITLIYLWVYLAHYLGII